MGWRELFSQWNTKTLGGSSKLAVSDYELITDGVHVEVDNLEALEMKNTVGQATNLLSTSGPIVGSQKISTTGVLTSTGNTTLFQPDEGQVWVCTGLQMDASGGTGSVTAVLMYYDGTNEVRIESNSTAGTAEFNITSTAGPLYLSNSVYLRITTSSLGAGEQVIYNAAFIRVR